MTIGLGFVGGFCVHFFKGVGFLFLCFLFCFVLFIAEQFLMHLLLPFTADPLVGSIATQYLTNRAEHDRIARQWTKRYAT